MHHLLQSPPSPLLKTYCRKATKVRGIGTSVSERQATTYGFKRLHQSQLGKCPNMCPFCTRKPAIHCPFIRLLTFVLKNLKLALRGWIHVGRSVCKLAGLKAHSDHQNPKKVALHGKTAYIDRFISSAMMFFYYKDSISPTIFVIWYCGWPAMELLW